MQKYSDTFFLDFEQAYHTAQQENKIIDDSGIERLQYCYYDGPLTDIPLRNLIQVQQSDFDVFFSNNFLPIPCKVVYKNSHTMDLSVDSPDIIADIINFRKKKSHKNSIHKDTYFIDQLEALNTAKQQNSITFSEQNSVGLQLCYYHGEPLQTELKNFIAVDLENVIDFFSDSALRFPTELRLHPDLDPSLKQQISSHFKTGINEAIQRYNDYHQELKKQSKKLKLDFSEKKLRIFISANTFTTTSNIKREHLAKQMKDTGYDVLIEDIRSPLEKLDTIKSIKHYINFNPHITLQVNCLENSYQSRDCRNISVWNRITSALNNYLPITKRTNDFIFSFSQDISQHLRRCGVERVLYLPEELRKINFNDLLAILLNDYLKLASRSEEPPFFSASIADQHIKITTGSEKFIDTCQYNLRKNLDILKEQNTALYSRLQETLKNNQINILCTGLDDELFDVLEVEYNQQLLFKLNHQQLKKSFLNIKTKLTESSAAVISFGSGFELLKLYQHTDNPINGHTLEVPIYIIEDDIRFFLFNLIVHDFSHIISSKRIYLFIEQSLDHYSEVLMESENQIPGYLINTRENSNYKQIDDLINNVFMTRTNKGKELKNKVEQYYSEISKHQWLDKFTKKNVNSLRVLGISCRFSSFLQYCMRDLIDGFKKMGATTDIHIESDDHKRMTNDSIIAIIDNYKPDLIVIIDHFRSEYPTIPKNIPFVNWIQDKLPNILNNQQPPEELDFTFVFTKMWFDLHELEVYKNHPIEFLPLGYNESLYYPLNDKDKTYDCDILFVTNLIEPSVTYEPIRNPGRCTLKLTSLEHQFVNETDTTENDLIRYYRIIEDYLAPMTLIEFDHFCNTLDPRNQAIIINKLLLERDISLEHKTINLLTCFVSTRLHFEYLNRMKTWPIKTLINANLDIDIHVYGKNWDYYQDVRQCARGVAENGEFLNKIMNTAKICLNGSPGTTFHMRAMEIIACQSFMISRKIAKDTAPLTDFFSNDDVVFYTDEQDLIKQVIFYLEHDNERERISENAYNTLIKTFNYSSISRQITQSIHSRIEQQI